MNPSVLKIAGLSSPLLAASFLGFVTGYLVPQSGSGPASAALSGILPAVIAAGGAIFTYSALKNQDVVGHTKIILTSISVILFLLCFLGGFQYGIYSTAVDAAERDGIARIEYSDGLQEDLQTISLKQSYLLECSNAEWYVNKDRVNRGLPPIPTRIFCPYAFDDRRWPLPSDSVTSEPGQLQQ